MRICPWNSPLEWNQKNPRARRLGTRFAIGAPTAALTSPSKLTVSPELKETDDFHKPKERKPSPPLKPTRLREEELHFTQGVQHQAERAKSGEEAKRAYLPLEFTIRVESEEIQGQEGSEPDSPSERPQQHSHHHRSSTVSPELKETDDFLKPKERKPSPLSYPQG
ncbi:hypothetical protein SAMN04488601_1011287 [Paenibacillus sp. 453mf]|nr:hypothetical protein SAMN04488601_1011287 [Paenibacillus sp. 453mf]